MTFTVLVYYKPTKTRLTQVAHVLVLASCVLLFAESTYQMKNYLTPKLSSSNFSYRDLFFDPSENKV